MNSKKLQAFINAIPKPDPVKVDPLLFISRAEVSERECSGRTFNVEFEWSYNRYSGVFELGTKYCQHTGTGPLRFIRDLIARRYDAKYPFQKQHKPPCPVVQVTYAFKDYQREVFCMADESILLVIKEANAEFAKGNG